EMQAALDDDWQLLGDDRREHAFDALAGFKTDAREAAKAYYHGFKDRPPRAADGAFAGRWGMAVELNDLHNVVKRAAAGGRSVVLGGHSLGAADAIAYAAWDFAGRAGYKDLKAVVLVDGGQMGAFTGLGPKLSLRAVK